MLYRGPSSRLETLIEKIQQNSTGKDIMSPGEYYIFYQKRTCLSAEIKFEYFAIKFYIILKPLRLI